MDVIFCQHPRDIIQKMTQVLRIRKGSSSKHLNIGYKDMYRMGFVLYQMTDTEIYIGIRADTWHSY